jgi:serine/threonine protein kinase
MDQNRRATKFPRSGESLKRALSNDENRSTKLTRKIPVIPTVSTPRGAEEDPWKRYKSILKLHQAGSATLVHRNSSSFQEYILMETKGEKELLSKIQKASHKNIVGFYEALYDRGTLFFIYEVMEVSLAQVFATPQGCLRPYEVAAFSTEILQGLHYIHGELRIAHGNLSAENVLVSMKGDVKIGKGVRIYIPGPTDQSKQI